MNVAAETQPAREIPQAKGLPLLGNTLDMARDPAQFFVKLYREYGPACRISVLGKPYVVLSGIEAANFMGSREGKDCLRSKEFWEGLVEEYGATRTLTGEDGESHKELRNIMRRGYSKESIKGRYNELVRITDRCFKRDWPVGESVRVLPAMQYMVTDQLGTILTGSAPLEYVDAIRTNILYILNVLVTRQRPKILLQNPKYKRAKARVQELRRSMVEDWYAKQRNASAEVSEDDPPNLIDDIMRAHVERPDVIPEQDLTVTLTGPYVAGLDTVANTTAAITYCVLKHPEVKRRVHEEVDALFADGEIDESTFFSQIPTLQGAIMEAMRLYPIAVAQMRTANKDFVFQGFQVREGEMIYMGTSVPHFMEEYYPEPTKFDVDRYAKPRAEHMQSGAYSPYGRGPHTCLGKSLAEVQLALSMARLFHKLDLELDPPDYDLKTKTAPTPGPATSFRVKVKGYRS
ncbi:cytochrome P450 [Algiphilus sp.]|uniref:cytochrome P450 n=1 Tax=Algiphilus sp. TaxID=1872431 RepID=UPI0025BBEAFB|nr:cytochrome P450 [Algiphilus sp.]MCK5770968.1 cytochrome P450 [Algiphilus sp.]